MLDEKLSLTPPAGGSAAALLEAGEVLRWDPPAFPLEPAESRLVAAARIGGAAKNISFDAQGGLRHATGEAADLAVLSRLLQRFGTFCDDALARLLPEYAGGLQRMRTSFRPAEIAGRAASWRRDDRRLHVDAFPSAPTGGRRILRMFCNIDQSGRPRVWRTGPHFEDYAAALLPQAAIRPLPGLGAIMAATGLTKSRRTFYDAQMLALHDAAKRDLSWQREVAARELVFQPGEVWMVFTDLVPHAALSGCNALEQTFLVEPGRMVAPERSPLAILGRRTKLRMEALV